MLSLQQSVNWGPLSLRVCGVRIIFSSFFLLESQSAHLPIHNLSEGITGFSKMLQSKPRGGGFIFSKTES